MPDETPGENETLSEMIPEICGRSAGTSAAFSTSRFRLGRIFVSDAARAALDAAGLSPTALLSRHARGDWGDVTPETKEDNERALGFGYRLMSCYRLRGSEGADTEEHMDAAWVFTEASRRVTLLVVQSEYGL